MAFKIRSVDHFVIGVTDLGASSRWYQRVLGVSPVLLIEGQPPSTFTFGEQMLRLRPISTGTDFWFTADNAAAGSHDICFLTDSPFQDIVDHLSACDVAIEVGPVERDGGQGKMMSIYCRDPDGSLIEISTLL